MRPTDTVRTLLAFVILVVLHFTLRPLLGWRASPDFLVIALLLVAIRVRPGVAALVGFAMGLVTDSMALTAFGMGALAMALVGFFASWIKAVFFADDLMLNAFFFFLGKWVLDAILLIGEHRLGFLDLMRELFVWSSLASAVTAVAGVALLLILRPILRPTIT